MKSVGKARNNGLYRHIRTSKEIIRNLLNDLEKIFISDTPLHRGGSKTRPPSTDGETPPAKNT